MTRLDKEHPLPASFPSPPGTTSATAAQWAELAGTLHRLRQRPAPLKCVVHDDLLDCIDKASVLISELASTAAMAPTVKHAAPSIAAIRAGASSVRELTAIYTGAFTHGTLVPRPDEDGYRFDEHWRQDHTRMRPALLECADGLDNIAHQLRGGHPPSRPGPLPGTGSRPADVTSARRTARAPR